ncbi:hypothetical protein MMC17_002339 [Xylographa soralifera]|nr:hypothetical protein [Xylographa soralifera]
MNTNVSSSNNTDHPTSLLPTLQQDFRVLGAGSCGTVFVHHDPMTVLKKANNDDNSLWNDYTTQFNVQAQLKRSQTVFHNHNPPLTTRLLFFISSNNHQWWTAHASKFPRGHQDPPMRILCLERIPPLNQQIREHLIDTFCPDHGRAGAKRGAGNADCIARLYLGRRRQPRGRPQQFFSLRNFSLHLDMAEGLGLDVEAYAAEMAGALARVVGEALGLGALSGEQVGRMAVNSDTMLGDAGVRVWEEEPAGLDSMEGRAVESLDETGMCLWMLDYDKCHAMEWSDEGVTQAVVAVEENDPYFPKPQMEREGDRRLWEGFKEAYLKASEVIMAEDGIEGAVLGLPRKFVEEWEVFREKKVEQARVSALKEL